MNRQHLHTILRHAEALADDRPDADLLGRFLLRRDDHAFATLVRRHGPMVWGVCRNLLPGDADAEDAFQATFLALVRGGRRIRDGDRLAAWLHGVAFRVAMKARRTAARRRQRETTAATAEATAPVSEAAWHDLLTAVHEEVGRLPEALRAAFVMCCLEGRRQADAAAQLGLKPNTLTTRLARARQRVIENLTRRGIAPATAAGAIGLGTTTGAATVPLTLAEQAIAFARTTETVSPTVLQLAQGAFDMTTRTKWLAAALLVATAMTTTVSTMFFSDAIGQFPGGPGSGPTGAAGSRGGGARSSSGGPSGTSTMAAMMAVRWEYKVVNGLFNNSEAEAEMNKLGEEGWELTAVVEKFGTAVLKRQKSRRLSAGAGGTTGFGSVGGTTSSPAPAEGTTDLPGSMPPGAAAPVKAVEAKEPGTHVIPLKHAKATELEGTIALLMNAELRDANTGPGFNRGARVYVGTRVKMAADARTNSLVVLADDAALKTIKELLEKLDVPEAESNKSKPSK
ncbi:sigma-70 family RNA polymerase sigma factor [Limnoglobus roseus]|uniref:RNA polymerase sigma factor SigM n=1 Tax=Limnoglobus roseus TaxID=2598579 RepID=A0A5C1A6Y8_9BACT|nr:sigma-70 family RNA polymerase sigma factor [Limnoglobus roseus]QEL13766.1 RNA polymerase sigma factor SigM [Limnoglobus roseus]